MVVFLKKILPKNIKLWLYRLKHPAKKDGWFGNYPTWNDAQKECSGYENKVILEVVKNAILKVKNGEAVYERDSVLFDEIQESENLSNIFNSISQNNQHQLNLIDFGGSLGSSYFQHKKLLNSSILFNWNIVEQKHFVDCGKKYFENKELHFFNSIDEAIAKHQSKVLFASSVIQYFEKPYELINTILNFDFEYIIIDRTGFIDAEKERITKQIVPKSIYEASYPCWFLNEQKFIEAFSNKYNLEIDFPSAFDIDEVLEDGVKVYRKGFIFKIKQG